MHSALMLLVQLSNISREVECLFFFVCLFALVCLILSVTGALYCLVLSQCPLHAFSSGSEGGCALTLCFAAISWPCSLVTFLRWTRSTLLATNTIGKASLHTRQQQVMNLTAAGRERPLTRLRTFCGSYLTSEP